MVIGVILSIVFVLSPKKIIIAQATTNMGTGTLSSGSTWDTRDHDYTTADFSNIGNFFSANNKVTINPTGQTFNLINQTTSTASLALFNGALDMSNPVTTSGTFNLNNASGFFTRGFGVYLNTNFKVNHYY